MRRRRSAPQTNLIIAAVGVTVLFVLAGVIAFFSSRPPAKADPDKPAANASTPERKERQSPPSTKPDPVAPPNTNDWTHKDLISYLNSKGLNCGWKSSNVGAFFRPAIFLKVNGADDDDMAQWAHFWRHTRMSDHQLILVGLYDSAQTARDKSGSNPDARVWGRFEFIGDSDELNKVFAVLPR